MCRTVALIVPVWISVLTEVLFRFEFHPRMGLDFIRTIGLLIAQFG